MADRDSSDNSNHPKVEAVYFETSEGQSSIFELVNGLEGVCTALDNMHPTVGDGDALEHIAQLSCAARALSSQLNRRWYGRKPPTRRQLEAVRKASSDWQRLCETAAQSQA